MAEPAATDLTAEAGHGHMPTVEQVHTFRDVMAIIKWAGLAIVCGVLLLTMSLCTSAGFFPSLVVTVIVGAAGSWYFLRKPAH